MIKTSIKIRDMALACLFVLLVLIILIGGACGQPSTGSREASQKTALEFVRLETTFRFDGIPETLEATETTSVGNGWQFTIEFDSRHPGYGNRSGQILAQVITHHTAEITVQGGLGVTKAVMDYVWDMIEQQMLNEVEISPAPIHEANVTLLMSNPPQVEVYIKGGLADGCTTFHDIEVTRGGSHINIAVTVQRPKDVYCPAVYTYFEKSINLGSDFTTGVTYTLDVNDYSTSFAY
jgi:hypothetical protein